ncbi:plastocyanin [Ramlibacter sp. USB13]|uniref:Plastocyanin n=1 Tax=Ramlibacter cellulosilyticus TaxID=2764187 RepID=A0A923MPS1_9BURK|nr:plastocyanin [Ramlibacter cellulosilyticus]MBC5783245.1 plastocyanin [Ramlibacter cellulosilyticus]
MSRSLLALALGALAWSAQAGPLKVTVLDKEGKPVPDAVVVLAPAAPGAPKPLPTKVTITQEKMRFQPAVALVGVGAQATFVNNDPWEHHVRASPAGIHNFDSAATGGFELRLDGKAPGKTAHAVDAKFDKAGAVLLGCHLHASMKAHVFVSDTPWAAVSGEQGEAGFDAVPEGPVRIRVWHADQLLDLPPQQLTLTNAPATATMQLQVVPRRRRV